VDWGEAYILMTMDMKAAHAAALSGRWEDAAMYARSAASYALLFERAVDERQGGEDE